MLIKVKCTFCFSIFFNLIAKHAMGLLVKTFTMIAIVFFDENDSYSSSTHEWRVGTTFYYYYYFIDKSVIPSRRYQVQISKESALMY